MPKVSVIMGIYNCADTLGASLDSLLAQSFSDFNIILCEDGSKDNTYAVADSYVKQFPCRFILIRNEVNKGLTHSLNRCLALADGEYIARQDGDDISLPGRFEAQVAFLNDNPIFAYVSSAMELADESGVWHVLHYVEQPAPKDFLRGSPFGHAPCMMRKKALLAVNGYRDIPQTLRAEDYDLWFRFYSAGYMGYNLKQPFYRMFDSQSAADRRTFLNRRNEAWVMRQGIKALRLPPWTYIFSLKPLLTALLPKKMYLWLRRRYRKMKCLDID